MLYAIELGWPTNSESVVRSLGSPTAGETLVDTVELIGSGKLQFNQRDDGLHIQLPTNKPGKYAYVYRITFKGQ
jgi:alpha-L-fucosidase